MSLSLIEPSIEYKNEYIEMIEEWRVTGDMVPFVLRYDYSDFDSFLLQMKNLKNGVGLKENSVSSSTYWLVDDTREIIGVTNIRHKLNDKLMQIGGHIGYGIRPIRRKQGNATELLKLALLKAKDMKISKALLTCNKENIGSAKTIIKNGGVLDSEDIIDGTMIQRYWIEIK